MLISDEAGPMAEGSLRDYHSSAAVRGLLARLDYLRTVYNVHYCTVPVQCVHNKVICSMLSHLYWIILFKICTE